MGESLSAAKPHATVLLATYNCEPWLPEQLASIFRQRDVQVSVVVSDDASTDATPIILRTFAGGCPVQVLRPPAKRFGNANRNFLRLISEAPIGDAEYVALSDHDDIWHCEKLARAVEMLLREGAGAYSSNVTAWWPDGRELLLQKAFPQKAHDYLFESAGPGCTFVLRRDAFAELQQWVRANIDKLQSLRVHDWLIYAYARTRGWNWHIDPTPTLRYRQHGGNEVGANKGWRAKLSRWRQLRDGSFRRDALAIAHAVGDRSPVTQALERFQLSDRWRLFWLAPECRRDPRHAAAMRWIFLLMR
jgi:rhamnosyltransferase